MVKANIIGIGGGSASGKSTVARELAKKLGENRTIILAFDSYYKDLSHIPFSEREKVNFDDPNSLDIKLAMGHLSALKKGNPIEKPSYDYKSHTRKKEGKVILPKQFVIIDGLFTLVFDGICKLLDYKIYIDTPDDIRIIRRIQRDIKERGRNIETIIDQYLRTVKPMHKEYIEPSKKCANIIINWEKYNFQFIKKAITQIEQIASEVI